MDPDGETDVNINIFRKYAGSAAIMGEFSIQGTNISGYTLELPWRNNKEFESCIPLKSYEAEVYYSGKFSQYALKLLNVKGRKNISIHPGVDASDTLGCPLIGSEIDMAKGRISGGKKLLKEMTDYIRTIQFIDYFFLHEQTNIQVNVRVDYSYILNSFKTLIQSIPENLK